jgi:hypothetical protein
VKHSLASILLPTHELLACHRSDLTRGQNSGMRRLRALCNPSVSLTASSSYRQGKILIQWRWHHESPGRSLRQLDNQIPSLRTVGERNLCSDGACQPTVPTRRGLNGVQTRPVTEEYVKTAAPGNQETVPLWLLRRATRGTPPFPLPPDSQKSDSASPIK